MILWTGLLWICKMLLRAQAGTQFPRKRIRILSMCFSKWTHSLFCMLMRSINAGNRKQAYRVGQKLIFKRTEFLSIRHKSIFVRYFF